MEAITTGLVGGKFIHFTPGDNRCTVVRPGGVQKEVKFNSSLAMDAVDALILEPWRLDGINLIFAGAKGPTKVTTYLMGQEFYGFCEGRYGNTGWVNNPFRINWASDKLETEWSRRMMSLILRFGVPFSRIDIQRELGRLSK